MIKDGYTNIDIIEAFPSYLNKIPHLDKMRQTYKEQEYSDVFRILEITYICGDTETGKTRYVMDKYGYKNVYKITNYTHPFDSYEGQDVILFDEFRSSLPITDLLQILDGYPCKLSARYADRVACFTKAFIISNIPFDKQYPNIQTDEPKSFEALRRRITKFLNFEIKDTSVPFYVKENIEIIETFE